MSAGGTPQARCPRCEASVEPGDLRCCICGIAVVAPEPVSRPRAELARCEQCGAAIEYSAETGAPRCAFCGSVMHLETAADPLEQAEAFLRFRVQAPGARAALKQFLSRRSFFRPGDLASGARLAEAKALWWPGWLIDAEARVSWTADSDAGTHQAYWAPHAGLDPLEFRSLLVPASRGLTAAECEAMAPGYELEDLSPQPEGPRGAHVERFDVTRSGARREVLATLGADARARVHNELVPGTRTRNQHTALVLEGLRNRRLGFPAWVLAYRYRNRLYRLVINGQDATRIVGTAPWSPWRVGAAILAAAALVGTLLALLGVLGAR